MLLLAIVLLQVSEYFCNAPRAQQGKLFHICMCFFHIVLFSYSASVRHIDFVFVQTK